MVYTQNKIIGSVRWQNEIKNKGNSDAFIRHHYCCGTHRRHRKLSPLFASKFINSDTAFGIIESITTFRYILFVGLCVLFVSVVDDGRNILFTCNRLKYPPDECLFLDAIMADFCTAVASSSNKWAGNNPLFTYRYPSLWYVSSCSRVNTLKLLSFFAADVLPVVASKVSSMIVADATIALRT